MTGLDWFLLAAAAVLLRLGWRLGLMSGLVTLAGIAAGGALGFVASQELMQRFMVGEASHPFGVMAGAVTGITLGQVLLTSPSQRLHDRVAGSALRIADSAGGAVLAVLYGAAAAWLLAALLVFVPSTALANLARGSAVLTEIDAAVPAGVGFPLPWLEPLARPASDLPVFAGPELPPAPQAQPGPLAPDARSAAAGAVVRILGSSQCGQTLVGSGILVGEGLVLTAAHLVAGVRVPYAVEDGRGIGAPGVLLHLDPGNNVAVLRVAGLRGRPVPLADTAPPPGDQVMVAGYPRGRRALDGAAGGVLGAVTVSGGDMYGAAAADREVLALGTPIRPGYAGGAVLTEGGQLLGVLFAAAEGSDGTGYAVGVRELSAALEVASRATAPASPGPCLGVAAG